MRINHLKAILKTGVRGASVLLLGAGMAGAQQVINLTAGPATANLPGGAAVPMWGYSCGTVASAVASSTATTYSATTATDATLSLSVNAYAGAKITAGTSTGTVQSNTATTITLTTAGWTGGTPAAGAAFSIAASTANCSSLNTGGGWSPVLITVPTGEILTVNLTNNLTFGANSVPTSLVVVGQVGGGLGDAGQRTTTDSPDHSNAQAATTWPIAGNPGVTPPSQGPRVQSFSTEVGAGATKTLTWSRLRPGTYLIESGTHPSIQGPMGLYGILVVTTAPTSNTAAGMAYPALGSGATGLPAVTYGADVPLLLSEIDPVQNNAVNTAVGSAGFSETAVWSGVAGACGDPVVHNCYPPAVNYTPLYYLINGVAFDKTHATSSVFAAKPGTNAAPVAGNVLVRLVNAGLRMHVPSVVGAQTGSAVPPLSGFTLIAEDGNRVPGAPRVQSEVFMAAGKTYDVMINASSSTTSALPVYDRELSLSGNATIRDGGMLAYIGVNGLGLPTGLAGVGTAVAADDAYSIVASGHTVSVLDPVKGVIANDTNVYAVQLLSAPTSGTVSLNSDGTFTYTANTGATSDSFTYCANGTVTGGVCSSHISATVTLNACTTCVEVAGGITVNDISYTSSLSSSIKVAPSGVLSVDRDGAGFPLSVDLTTVSGTLTTTGTGSGTVKMSADGGFTAAVTAAGTYTFTYKAKNSQGTTSALSATVTLVFPSATGLTVTLKDPTTGAALPKDYRWIIEEDRTFYIDPNNTTNTGSNIVPTFGTNFHTSYMPVVATGCVGTTSCESGQKLQGQNAVCDIGNGVCRTDAAQETAVDPNTVHLDPTKRYYISVLPGDAGTPFSTGCTTAGCAGGGNPGHGMGGAPIAPGQTAVTVLVEPTPFPPSKLTVFVFEDDFPLNGEQDGGGGIDVLSPNEAGLGQFNITIFDDAGGTGDATGQVNYDMFNQPLSNSLAGYKDPATGLDACPIGPHSRIGTNDKTQTGITGTIVTCPKYESDGRTLSPLAGQAIVANMMPGRYGVVATPGADRIAKGEEWLQTNTLDGQKAHDSFLRIGEPSFFQEYGPSGFHVAIGFANPAIINSRLAGVCNGTDPNVTGTGCGNTVTGTVTTERMSRTPDERLYSSGDNSSFGFTQCYVSFGDPDGEDFAFTKCDSSGHFTLSGLPNGDWRVTVFDQWNDMLVDGLSTPVRLGGGSTDMGPIAINQWQANIYTTTFFDENGNGVRDAKESGLALVPTNIRFRDGSFSNFNNTDLDGNAGFNEVFPLFSWYVVETDSTRYKNTGIHVVYDAGGPADGTPGGGNSSIAANMANSQEAIPLPADLRFPGAFYCANADCTDAPSPLSLAGGSGAGGSTGRVDPPWVVSEGWQGFSGQNSFIEFGKAPFIPGENGGIRGHVVYASTRPFDDPRLLLQTSWMPLIPNVTINLYQEGTAPDGSMSLTLVDSTKTSSWDDWAQGFRSDGKPNMNCPGQGASTGTNADMFFFSLYNQPQWLDLYNSQHGGPAVTNLPYNSEFKCYDGMHNWNQVQPAPYDGMYQFPSIAGRNPSTGAPTGGSGSVTGTNCTICVKNPSDGTPMLPAGKYVVEVMVPPGYELVKEEDKNILIGDNFIAPVTVEFPGLGGSIFILPDQASVVSAYNGNNAQNATSDLGRNTLPSTESDTGEVEVFWPCVGASRMVPDYISLFPGSNEVAPFAGATRNLCDRKEVQVNDQSAALAKFYLFTSAHAAAHFTGVITDDFTSEFDPFSPQFGEKFSPPDLPISIKDWNGNEINRIYSDHWGAFNGLNYSTWEVNPPNPTGYSPTMMVTCMNDPGPIPDPAHAGQVITDPLFNPSYSQFCYEIPFMPGQTQYMDTPVTPTAGFAGAGYNNPDCSYPDLTPAISEVDGDQVGPWVSGAGKTLTITALGDQMVDNYGYSGPQATSTPFNQKKINRHYGFGSRCTSPTPGSATCNTASSVTIGGVAAAITGWTDTSITVTVPATGTSGNTIRPCAVQQQTQYQGATAYCGQLAITAGNGKQSIDTVTVTVGGKQPTHVAASASIQTAIDVAKPGDLIIIDPTCTPVAGNSACSTATLHGATPTQFASPSAHNELLVMWKPVRLQGVGAASSVINANTHPAGKLDGWRQRINCLFGLALNGTPITTTNPFDSTGATTCGSVTGDTWTGFKPYDGINPQVDRLPLEATVGWDASLNGNLAELLQEPSLMGALEGAGITVLGKGVKFPSNPYDPALASGFPTNTTLLSGTVNSDGTYKTGDANSACHTSSSNTTNPFASNFSCNPSSIDGLSITDSSQGGGGIFVHGWAHNLQIANNRVQNNSGTLSGGINVGQGEFPPGYFQGSATNAAPGSCESVLLPNTELPYCFDLNVNVHNNAIRLNSSTGDELFSATPAGAGGISFCTGSDYYKFNYNWVCGNLSTGDGGGFGHLGFIYNGDIEHNSVLFNQSTNPTIATNGGGILIYGAPDVDPPCGATTDADCLSAANLVTPSDGVGPNLVINANLIMGNAAESGSGGGLRLHNINGTDVVNFAIFPSQWYSPMVTNNIIANNVAGWDGGGISLQDALAVNIINNTIISNDTTASSGVLFNTLGAPLASSQGPCSGTRDNTGVCTTPWTSSVAQPAGLVTIQNSAVLSANLPNNVLCPNGHYQPGTGGALIPSLNASCRSYSYPLLVNNIFWENRAFFIGVGSLGTGTLNQQNLVTLYDGFSNLAKPANQSSTGQCPSDPNVYYWEIGVRGDTGRTNHAGGLLSPSYSLLTDSADYPGANNIGTDPTVISQYCNGARVPPENGGMGYQVPPGISDATVPNPLFSLTPSATVDEGNNWININWGPLALTNPSVAGADGNYGGGGPLGNYAIPGTSTAVNRGTSGAVSGVAPPITDFFGATRTPPNDIGAVEPFATPVFSASVSPSTLAFGNWATGTTSTALTVTVTNTGNQPLAGGTFTIVGGAPFSHPAGGCGATLAIGASCTYNVVFSPTTTTGSPFSRTLTVSYTGATVTGTPVSLTGAAVNFAVTPASLTFANQPVGTASATQTLTVHNSTGAARHLSPITVTAPFARSGGTCPTTTTATLANNGNCTINVVFNAPATPTAGSSYTGTVTIATDTGFTVANSPVALSGTSVPVVISANLTPTSWSPQATRGVGTGLLCIGGGPCQAFTLTNTGNVPLTNITQGVLGGANAADYSVVHILSGCGPTGNGQLASNTTLNPNATCVVTVQFLPKTSDTVGTKFGTISITDSAGTQTSSLSGTAQ